MSANLRIYKKPANEIIFFCIDYKPTQENKRILKF